MARELADLGSVELELADFAAGTGVAARAEAEPNSSAIRSLDEMDMASLLVFQQLALPAH
ncbi:MAG TPA: hypothetical protein VET30_02060 [Pseudoxanthomonas sp.]|nr:hypothetical protein [Pseudoxanthomonas sp.]